MKNEPEELEDFFTRLGFGKFQIVLLAICCINSACESVEVVLLTFLGPVLVNEWKINAYQVSFLTIGLLIGMAVAGIVTGILCDKYGRMKLFVIGNIFLFYVGCLSSISPTIEWFIFLRSCIGFSITTIHICLFALITEFSSIKFRVHMTLILLLSWSLGTYFVVTIFYLFLPIVKWRGIVIISNIPLLISLPLMYFVFESPRFLLLRRQKSAALDILNKMTKYNKVEKCYDIKEPDREESSIRDLAHSSYRSTTFITSCTWFICGLNYYAILLMVAQINDLPRQCIINLRFQLAPVASIINNNMTLDDSCYSTTSWQTYKDSYISNTGELIFTLLVMCLLNYLSRKTCLYITSVISILCLFLVNICMPSIALTMTLFILRGSISNFFNVTIIYTSEVFPTSIRSLSLGLCAFCSRIGAICGSLIMNIIMVKISFIAGLMAVLVLNVIACILICFLPYETKGRKLYQTANESLE